MPWLGPSFRRAIQNDGLGIALTGAGSWLGQALLAILAGDGLLPPPQRLRLFGSFERAVDLGIREAMVERLARATPLSGGRWLLLHFAFLGKERTADLSACDFITANDRILNNVLRLIEPANTSRMIFASSGAVYQAEADVAHGRPANPYGLSKIDHERRLTEWCARKGVPLVIPRIFNIGGPFINKIESYALSSFIQSAQTRGEIRIEATRPTFRSYVHVNEVLSLVLETALARLAGPPLIFDTAGLEIVEMGDLATAVVQTLGLRDTTIERASFDGRPPDRYVGNGTHYNALLAAQGRTVAPLGEIIADTARDLAARSVRATAIGEGTLKGGRYGPPRSGGHECHD